MKFKASTLLASNDALVWAKAFEQYKKENNWSLEEIDEGLMIGWFANAMAAQEFAMIREQEKKDRELYEMFMNNMNGDGVTIK